MCCFKIQITSQAKDLLSNVEDGSESNDVCRFCGTDKCLMKIGNNWKQFNDRTEGFLNECDFPVRSCPQCFFFFDTVFNFKSKLSLKFPYLAISKKKSGETTPQKQNDTPKRKSLSKSPSSSKKRKIFDNCFNYLQPLCNSNFHVDQELKTDKKLYKKIPYVNLQYSKNVEPKMRPKIKIKLKVKTKKSRSEELPNKKGKQKIKRYSCITPVEDRLDETPKAASVSNLVPKRRVSVYIDENEKKSETSDELNTEEIKDLGKDISSDETSEVVEETEEKELEQNGVEEENKVPEDVEEKELEQNGVKESTDERSEELEATAEVKNGEKSDSQSSFYLEKHSEESTDLDRTLTRNESEGSESDTLRTNLDESFSGSAERKKKRVTFFDEMWE